MRLPAYDADRIRTCAVSSVLSTFVILSGCRDAARTPAPPPASSGGSNGPQVAAPPPPPAFVGSRVCAECHSDQFESYLHTAHSRSLSLVDPAGEPPDGEFQHKRSGRSYGVYREQGQMRHREWITAAGGETIAADYPVKYLVGSGRHSRTYLVEADGFLVESPITWFASQQTWDLSPGYDLPEPQGFERPAEIGCLACHVGRAKSIDDSLNRIAFDELAIGCERCHGAGADHVTFRRKSAKAADDAGAQMDGVDPIVHPGKLSRDLREAICAQCHLRGDATVFLPGLGPMDFQPGQPLASVRVDYRPDRPDQRMAVVGHVEQMWLSRCYSESGSLTCVTCHDMHAPVAPENAAEYYRARCLNCHMPAACGLPTDDVGRTSRQDNCLQCHMPQTETDIPHIAFTHHRIGIHENDAPPPPPVSPEVQLVPMMTVDGLPHSLQQRCLALGYLEFSPRQANPLVRQACQERAVQLIDELSRETVLDGDVLAGLARVYWEHQPSLAVETARQALDVGGLSPGAGVNSYFVVGDTLFHARQPGRAQPEFEALTRRRRNSEDWLLLGLCRQAQGDTTGAKANLEQALRISPFRDDIRQIMRELWPETRDHNLSPTNR